MDLSELGPPSDGNCWICWTGPENGLLVYDRSACGGWVHPKCLRWFGARSIAQYERMYVDTLDVGD